MVAAGVASVDLGARFFLGISGLRDAGERVEFADDADDRMAAAVAGNEAGGHPGHAGFDGEALGF